ncbi:hypothetical protein [Neptuniibacter sp. QD37_11]|uniref:hypothetical protein n=1 Tax=Neptuniibacter sp. QD37_11 TaxID=3398209 RepID=UPI0039F5001D
MKKTVLMLLTTALLSGCNQNNDNDSKTTASKTNKVPTSKYAPTSENAKASLYSCRGGSVIIDTPEKVKCTQHDGYFTTYEPNKGFPVVSITYDLKNNTYEDELQARLLLSSLVQSGADFAFGIKDVAKTHQLTPAYVLDWPLGHSIGLSEDVLLSYPNRPALRATGQYTLTLKKVEPIHLSRASSN